MKNVLYVVAVVCMVLMGCGTAIAQTSKGEYPSFKGKKVLVVYYSNSGNTEEIAKQIQKTIGGDLFKIETVKPYPSEYHKMTEQAKKEIEDGYKPPIKKKVRNIRGYDIVFVGSPSWWATIAPPVSTFLSQHDLSGKIVVPFVTHGGTGMGGNASATAKLAPKAKMVEGRAFSASRVSRSQKDVENWLNGLVF